MTSGLQTSEFSFFPVCGADSLGQLVPPEVVSRERFVEILQKFGQEMTPTIEKALSIASVVHSIQPRKYDKSKNHYTSHVLQVASTFAQTEAILGRSVSEHQIVVALLHDIVEDGNHVKVGDTLQELRIVSDQDGFVDFSLELISELFGKEVAYDVYQLSKMPGEESDFCVEKMHICSKNPLKRWIVNLKCVDNICNLVDGRRREESSLEEDFYRSKSRRRYERIFRSCDPWYFKTWLNLTDTYPLVA